MNSPFERATARRASRWLSDIKIDPEMDHQSTPTNVRDTVIDAMQQHLCDHYTRRPGIAPLCQAIAQRLSAHGVAVDPNDGVVITGGVQEARFVAVRALAPGHKVYVPTTAQTDYQIAAEFAAAPIISFDPDGELPNANGGLLVLPTCNPATVQPFAAATLVNIAAWAKDTDLTIVADETGHPLLDTQSAVSPFAALPDMADCTLTLGEFNLTPGLAAWQVAWFAGPKPLVATVRTLKQAMTICSPAPGQYAALAAMQNTGGAS